MKVGTDGVLLGAWVDPKKSNTILDIGCGTGVISLMLAQKSNAKITALEIEENAAQEAKENIQQSPWPTQIMIEHQSFQDYLKNPTQKHFDLIVSNPPFFDANQNKGKRSLAREKANLPYSTLLHGCSRLLTEEGRLCVIVPSHQKNDFIQLSEENGLFTNEITYVQGHSNAAVKRLLIQLGKKSTLLKENRLIIEEERNEYTEDYRNLLKDYLLIF